MDIRTYRVRSLRKGVAWLVAQVVVDDHGKAHTTISDLPLKRDREK